MARKMARKLFVYRKEKRKGRKRVEKHCCELNRKEFSKNLLEAEKKEITMSRKPRSFSIIALIFFVCRFATWLAGNEGRWLKFTGGWIKISRRFAFKKKKTFTLVTSLCTFPRTIRKKKASVNPSWKIHREINANIV